MAIGIVEQLSKIGFNFKMDVVDWPTLVERRAKKKVGIYSLLLSVQCLTLSWEFRIIWEITLVAIPHLKYENTWENSKRNRSGKKVRGLG